MLISNLFKFHEPENFETNIFKQHDHFGQKSYIHNCFVGNILDECFFNFLVLTILHFEFLKLSYKRYTDTRFSASGFFHESVLAEPRLLGYIHFKF
jgi:hypothetical protein